MKNYFVEKSLLIMVLTIFMSCTEENLTLNENLDRPGFEALSLSSLENTTTPYEEIFKNGGRNNGRLQDEYDESDLKQKIEEIFPEVTYIDDIDSEVVRGIEVWEVEIELPDGAELDFYISKDLFEVVKIEGDDVTPRYEVNPGMGFITLSQALNAAENSIANEVIEFDDWELSFSEGVWIYIFETEKPDDLEIFINASNGELIGVYDDGNDSDDGDVYDDDDEDEDGDDD